MIELLKENLIADWNQWVISFREFVNYGVIDDESKLWEHRYERDYCTWKQVDGNLYTISFQYVHCLSEDGTMHCLRESNPDLLNAISNYKILYSNINEKILPILESLEEVEIDGCSYYYTKFASPNNELGYPSAFNIANIMINSTDVPTDFRKYITELINAHCTIITTARKLQLPFYKNHHALVNHFVDSTTLYFKDTMFEFTSDSYTVEELTQDWISTLDGFRRAKGIISAYKSRQDMTQEGVDAIYTEIENLITYAKHQCQKSMN